MNFLQQIQGEPLIYVIIAFPILAVALFLERSLYFLRARTDTQELLRGLMNLLKNNNVTEAIANCDNRTGPVGEVFRAAIERWAEGEEAVRFAVNDTIKLILPRLENNMKLLASISTITPVLGLLGTLFSMMSIFNKMGEKGGHFVPTNELAVDIKQALICTAAGLLAALAVHLFYFILMERIERIVQEMNKGASEIIYFLSKNKKSDAEAIAAENLPLETASAQTEGSE